MRSMLMPGWLLLTFMLSSCGERVNYTKALFRHIPDDPELLVVVRPNEVARAAEVAFDEVDLTPYLSNLNLDPALFANYHAIIGEMLTAVGVPWEKVESLGFMLYLEKPVIVVCGNFRSDTVATKLKELGFDKNRDGFFDYIYGDQKLHLPSDGLMMMAEAEQLDFLQMVPKERRLWNREDFAQYRRISPLKNSIFIWTHPPESFLSNFPYRDDLGDLSLALDFGTTVSFKAALRINSPEKTVYLHDILLGILTFSQGALGSDPELGPLLKSVKVSQDNKQVIASAVVSHGQIKRLKTRLADEIKNPNAGTFQKIREFFDQFD